QGEELLRKAVAIEPDNADAAHSLGLLRVRQHDYAGAVNLLRQAHELAADNARYAYVYAVALSSAGGTAQAITGLEGTHRKHPGARDVLAALLSISRDKGDIAAALRYARELAALDPDNPQLRALLLELEKGEAR